MNPTENLPVGAIYSPVSVTRTLQSLLNSKLTHVLMSTTANCPLLPGFGQGTAVFLRQ